MRRRVRLFFIFLLELQIFLLMLLVYIGLVVYFFNNIGFFGILVGLIIGTVINCSIGGLVFLFLELYYSLRSFETVLDEEIRPVLEKIVRIEYRIYEMFYDQFHGGERSGSEGNESSTSLGHR